MSNTKTIGVIPARFASHRFPGKMLADLAGKPLIQRVYENARKSSLGRLLIATDDARILKVCAGFGAECVMTSPSCPSGTDRIAEACRDIEADIVVNIQGDEPFISPGVIDKAVEILDNTPSTWVSTVACPARTPEDVASPDKVKVVMDGTGHALYFSRSPIPRVRDGGPFEHLIHIGLYAYRKDFLLSFVRLGPSPLEQAEKLEQLRILENGFRIRVARVPYDGFGIDTQEDLQHAVNRLCQNSSSSRAE